MPVTGRGDFRKYTPCRFWTCGATALAREFGVSETVIGLTLVAVGTSLPELATSMMAARHDQPDVAFGNIIGSGIFNVLGILGATTLVAPLPVDPVIARDMWLMATVTLITDRGADLAQMHQPHIAVVFLLGYTAYITVLNRTF